MRIEIRSTLPGRVHEIGADLASHSIPDAEIRVESAAMRSIGVDGPTVVAIVSATVPVITAVIAALTKTLRRPETIVICGSDGRRIELPGTASAEQIEAAGALIESDPIATVAVEDVEGPL